MQTKLKNPNLPGTKVGLVLVKNEIKTVKALNSMGIRTVSPVRNPVLPDEISEHPDIVSCFTGDEIILSSEQTELKNFFTDCGFSVKISSPLKTDYPFDTLLNFAVTNGFVLGNFNCADDRITECTKNKNKINVKQGYAKCNLCIVSENAFITEDSGIAKALKSHGADVLRINPGDIVLTEKHCGFLGGATGKISKTELAVNGSLKYHRDGDKISGFLKKHGVSAVELFDGKITDIGGIIPLTEETE